MWKWLLLISLLFLLGLASGTGLSSSGSGVSSSGTGSSSSVGLPSGTGNTLWQEGAIEGLRIGFHLGEMHTQARQGYNISGFNAEVDNYNAWVQKNFGNNPNLMMAKMQETGYGMPGYIPVPRITSVKPIHAIDASFNRTTPVYPAYGVYNGRIFDMPAGAWYTTNGPYLPDYYGRDYYGGDYPMGWV